MKEEDILENEISNLVKIKEQLSGYACGYHRNLIRFINNRIEKLRITINFLLDSGEESK